MYYTFCKGNPNTPQKHDKQDYREIGGGGRSATKQTPSGTKQSESGPSIIKSFYTFDVKSPKKLVGFATNVFRGRVAEEVRATGEPLSGPEGKVLPQTQFYVEVFDNVKGDLEGTVTVDVTGGYDEKGREVRVEGDPQLQPGGEYLFYTGHDEEKGWYTVVAQPYGAAPIGDEVERGEVEARFKQAEAEQVTPDSANR